MTGLELEDVLTLLFSFPREKNDDDQKGKENNKVKTSSSSKPVQDS